MKATKFMRIPFFVTGYEVTEDNMDDIARWCEGLVVRGADSDPFIRVPVTRATSQKQTEARVGQWVIVSMVRGEPSFKVYSREWLLTQFYKIPDNAFDVLDQAVMEPSAGEPAPNDPRVNHCCGHNHSNVHPLPKQPTGRVKPVGFRSTPR